MGIDAKRISLWDTLRLQFYVALPTSLWGLAAPNRLFVALLTKWDAGKYAVRFLDELRSKYRCGHLWVWFPLKKTLLVFDPESVDEVLRSADNFADPDLKVKALSHFAPNSLVISGGNEWADRRRFNESALGFGGLHLHHDSFKEIVVREVDALTAEPSRVLRWSDFEAFAQRVSHQVILGSGQAEPEMAVQLARLARRGNIAFLPRDRHSFSAFYEQIDRHLERHCAFQKASHAGQQPSGPPPSNACLMHDAAALLETGGATESTRVPNQIGFWFYVLKDAIELHVARTLALIAAHPEVQDRVRKEVRQAPELTAQAIDGFGYLEACIKEQLRLWTPVPLLLRRAHRSFSLRGEIPIRAEQQILIHAGFRHRDPGRGEAVDRFSPDSVTGASPPLLVFSAYRQSCAGEFLARFVLKAALASLLAKYRFELVAPSIGSGRIPSLCDHFKIELRPLTDQ